MRGLILAAFLCSSGVVANPVPITAWNLHSSTAPATKYQVEVPCTVFACLMQTGAFSDVFYSDNIYNISTAQFDVSWFYTTTISAPTLAAGATASLMFKGLNYRANIIVNGVQVGSNASVAGAFRYFEFDVTAIIQNSGETLNISVQVFPQHDRSLPSNNHDLDLGITFVDWAPTPPDNNAGLWREVLLITRPGPVALKNAGIAVQLSGTPGIPQSWPSLFKAAPLSAASGPDSYPSLWPATPANVTAYVNVSVQATNFNSAPFSGLLLGTLVGPDGSTIIGAFSQEVILAPFESRLLTIAYDPSANPGLALSNPLLWWPWQMGPPQLHVLNISIVTTTTTGGSAAAVDTISDTLVVSVGLRETSSTIDANGNVLFSVNRHPILIRGGGWSPDLFLRHNVSHVWAQLAYTVDMGLNTIRLEGKMDPDDFFNFSDKLGLLAMPGWCCCDAWQHWPWWQEEQYNVSAASMRDQAARLRSHPSVLAFFLSSDELPPANVESAYLAAVAAEAWPNPTISAASAAVSNITGTTGVKMSGPYSWVPPNYWLLDNGTQPYAIGGAWGFLTEGGPGENPLTNESLRATVSAADLWPAAPDNCWGHCGSTLGSFGKLTRFNGPLSARYGNASNLEQYLWYSHAAAYEGHRAMFEGYTVNKYTFSTGVIQWMLNNAFPSNIWHLFDWYNLPGPTYAATKKACEPIHVMYNYFDNSMWVTNSWYVDAVGAGAEATGFLAQAAIVAANGSVLYVRSDNFLTIPADGAAPVRELPSPSDVAALMGLPAGAQGSYFVRMLLTDGIDPSIILSDNSYWLSLQMDELNWDASTWYNTPCTSYADFSALSAVSQADLKASASGVNSSSLSVTLENQGAVVAWLVKLRAVDSSIQASPLQVPDVLPIQWSDNFITLLPGERRTVYASFNVTSSVVSKIAVLMSGFNVPEQKL